MRLVRVLWGLVIVAVITYFCTILVIRNINCATPVNIHKDKWSIDLENLNLPLHHYDHYHISEQSWDLLVWKTSLPIGIRDGDTVFESGCGSGAYLHSLRKHFDIRVSGADFSETQIKLAKKFIPDGIFYVGDVRFLNQTETNSVNHATSFGVFFYLENYNNAEMALREMLRITKPGGSIYIGNVDDPDEVWRENRGCMGEGGFYIRKNWWNEMAVKYGFYLVSIVDERNTIVSEWKNSRWRYSVYIKKPKEPSNAKNMHCFGSSHNLCPYF